MGAGSSSSAQGDEVAKAAQKNKPKNYMENQFIKQESLNLNIDHALVAYAYQKQNTIEIYEKGL